MAMVDEALAYAARGWRVFPLVERDKIPAVKEGFKAADVDAEWIGAMWSKRPNMNIGIATGNSLIVIDLDVDDEQGEDGVATLRAWEREHGELPETCSVVTGRGGLHLYYIVDEPVGCSVNKDAGVDIRGDGGYVVAPPSIHPKTLRAYEWEVPPDEMEPARADDNVMAFVRANRPSGFGDRDKFKLPKEAGKGCRNDTLFKYACSLQAMDWDDDAIIASVETFNKMSCKPPVSDDEVERVLRSALSHPKGRDGGYEPIDGGEGRQKWPGRPRGSSFNHARVAQNLIDNHGACILDGMPAIRVGTSYRVGWDSIQSKIVEDHPSSKASQRKEACEYIRLAGPRVSQSDPRYIAFSNGVLDVLTMEFWKSRDDLVITNVIPHDWNPWATCDAVCDVLDRMACGNPVTFTNLTEVMGLCMYRSAKYPAVPMLLGSGSNGKSTYIDMVRALIGNENISSLDLNSISERFMTADLAGKLANLGDDIPAEFADARTMGMFKKVSAGSTIRCDVKGVTGFDFKPYCTMVFSANTMPRIEKMTDGEARRLLPIYFRAKFSRDDPDYDPDILSKVTSEEACQYMAVLGVEGLRGVIERKGVTMGEESIEGLREIRLDNEPVQAWIDDEGLSRELFVGMPTATAYIKYTDWCDESGVKMKMQRRSLTSRVREIFDLDVRTQRDGSRTYKAFSEPRR